MRKLGLSDPVLIGHSMGGKTAMTMLQEYEIDVAKAFIVDIAPVSYQHNHDDILEAMLSVDLALQLSRADVDSALSEAVPDQALRQFLLQNLRQDGSGLSWRINLKSIMNNARYLFDYDSNNVSKVDTTFIGGGNSDYILPAYHETIYSMFPNSTIETVPGAGHWLHAEKPDALLELIN